MKNNFIKSFLLIIIILAAASFLTGCDEKDPLLGKWQESSSGITMEFGENGDLTMSNGGTSLLMTYEKQDPNGLLIHASSDGTIPDQSMTYRIEEDKLIITVDGVDTVFDRVN